MSVALLLAGCVTASPGNDGVLSNALPGPAGGKSGSNALFVIHPQSLGPITPTTRAELRSLQDLLGSRYVVTMKDKDELDVMLDKELVFYVIANDDGTLFNVHCPSEKVAIELEKLAPPCPGVPAACGVRIVLPPVSVKS